MENRQLVLLSLVALALFHLTVATDIAPLQDFCVADLTNSDRVNGFPCKDPKTVQAGDFSYKGLNIRGNTSNHLGSKITLINVLQLPGLNTLGISMARVDYDPYGLNPPHTHPRATEIYTVLKGTLLVGFITTNPENRFISKIVRKGDVFVFPMGLVHFQYNLKNATALAMSGLSSQNPGFNSIASATFGSNPAIPSDILAKAFQIDRKLVEQLQMSQTSSH